MGAKILLVDDEDYVVKVLQTILKKEGYEVISTQSPRAAEDIGREQEFDLFILDILMPEENGAVLAKHLREHHPQTPVLFTSGDSPDNLRAFGINLSNGFLGKPYTNQTFLKKVRDVLDANKKD